MQYLIYGMIDPRDDRVFYVGRSQQAAQWKAYHLQDADTPAGLRLHALHSLGLLPRFVLLEAVRDLETAVVAEMFWSEIFRMRAAGWKPATNGRSQLIHPRRAPDGSSTIKRLRLGKPEGHWSRWEPDDDAALRRMRAQQLSVSVIAAHLNRSVGAIKARLRVIKA